MRLKHDYADLSILACFPISGPNGMLGQALMGSNENEIMVREDHLIDSFILHISCE